MVKLTVAVDPGTGVVAALADHGSPLRAAAIVAFLAMPCLVGGGGAELSLACAAAAAAGYALSKVRRR